MKLGTPVRSALAMLLLAAAAMKINAASIDETLPKNNVGNVTREFFTALNSGSPEQIERFIRTKTGTAPWGKMTPEKAERMLKKLQEQSGGVSLERVANGD